MKAALDSVLGKTDGAKNSGAAPREKGGMISIKGSMKDAKKLGAELSSLPVFQEAGQDGDAVKAMIVESTDRQKRPHLYISFRFFRDRAEISYSVPPEIPNPSARKLQVIKTAFTLLSLLEAKESFVPDRADMYSKTMAAFDIAAGFSDNDALRMKYDLDRYATENSSLKAELARLKEEKDGLGLRLLELEKTAERMEERVRQLERLTDGELDHEIVKWVEDHNGKLNDSLFCSTFNIGAQRLEERLDSLSKRGVIRFV